MKIKVLLATLLGVMTLQSCTSYRVKVVEHSNDVKYYFPQKKIFIGDWDDIQAYDGDYTKGWAKIIIDKDKSPKHKNITYIKEDQL
jgi:hypothetical protein